MKRLILASNQLPVNISWQNGKYRIEKEEETTISGLQHFYSEFETEWVGLTGFENHEFKANEEHENVRASKGQPQDFGVRSRMGRLRLLYITTPEEPEDARLRRSQLLNAGVHVFIVHRVVVFLTTPEQPEDASFKRSQPPLPSSLVGSVNDRRHRVALRCCLRNNSGKNLFKQSTSTSGTFPRLLCTFFENVLDPLHQTKSN